MPIEIVRLPRIPWDGDKPITAFQDPFGEVANLTTAFIGAGAPHAAGVDTSLHTSTLPLDIELMLMLTVSLYYRLKIISTFIWNIPNWERFIIAILLASFPVPRPPFRFTVLQATKSWVWDWERGYYFTTFRKRMHVNPLILLSLIIVILAMGS